MPLGDGPSVGRVALLIDFENLVRAVDEEDIDCEAVFRLADEYGRVLVANAYADWRRKDVNQHQTDLYALGIDLVHVLGHRQGALVKNAVDVKMAVDAVSYVSSLAHIDVYVIVSGDRDFIHVLKELRRHGKIVVGVSPSSAVSRDFSALCDRFVRYEALTSTAEPVDAEGIGNVRSKLADIVRSHPDGLHASMVKTMLRRVLSSTFDESAYGFGSFSQFLQRMDDVVRVVPPPATGGDLRVYPVRSNTPSAADPDPADIDGLARRANLHKSRYERNTRRRRATLAALFDVMAAADAPFRLVDMPDEMRERGGDDAMSLTDLVKYARVLHVGRAFALEADPEDIPFRERPMSLAADVRSPEDFVVAYETAIAARLLRAAGESPVGTAHLADLLGLDAAAEDDCAYCAGLLARARPIAPSAPDRSKPDSSSPTAN